MSRPRKQAIGVVAVALLIILLMLGIMKTRPAEHPSDPPGSTELARVGDQAFLPETADTPVPEPSAPEKQVDAADKIADSLPTVSAEVAMPPEPTPTPAPYEVWLIGYVTDTEGQPVEGARVSLGMKQLNTPTFNGGGGNPVLNERIEIADTTTDKSGRYELPLGERFPYSVIVEAEGLAPAGMLLYPAGLRLRTDENGRRYTREDFQLGAAHTFVGRVVDDEGAPVAAARIEARILIPARRISGNNPIFMVCETGKDGRFALDVPQGIQLVTLYLFKAGYTSATYAGKSFDQEEDFVLSRFGGIVSGIVETADGSPAPGAMVTIYSRLPPNMLSEDPLNFSTTAGAKGEFEFKPTGEGSWTVVAKLPGNAAFGLNPTAVQNIVVGKEQVLEDVKLVLPPTLIVRGTVKDAESGDSIVGVKIYRDSTFEQELDAVFTDEDGRFDFGVLSLTEDQWRRIRDSFRFKTEGYLTAALDVGPYYRTRSDPSEIRDGAIELEVLMKPLHTVYISGQVTNENGVPAANVLIQSTGLTFPESRTFSNERGNYTLPVVGNSKVHLEARPPDSPITYTP